MKLVIDDRVPNGLVTVAPSVRCKFENAECVVEIKNAYKHYGKGASLHSVLKGLNMNIPKGVIYALIGASGCGKTTLFSCMIGRRKLNSGSVRVLGEIPGTRTSNIPGPIVGFMPQEVALFNQFTTYETLYYFGALNGVNMEVLDDKIRNLMALLELVDMGQFVKTLSGGQQRRLSLAATLIHDPELIILDEPTVGIDPLVREKIWDYLTDICKAGTKTIIISTHYIEEAQKADYIAMMRKGVLIAEADRSYIQQKHNEISVEKIFLNLSRNQDCEERLISNNNNLTEPKNVILRDELVKQTSKPRPIINRRHIDVLLKRNFLFIIRSLGVMGFILGAYTCTVLCFCIAIGGIPNYLKVAVANLELNETDRLQGNCPFNTVNCTYEMLSCRYLNKLNKEMKLVYVETPEEAWNEVRLGKAWVSLYFSKNYSEAYETKVNGREYIDDWTFENSQINVRWDGSNAPLNHIIRKKLFSTYEEFLDEMKEGCDLDTRVEGIPIHYEEPIYGSFQHNFRDYPAPGFILTNVFFFAVASTACAFISEKATNCVERSFANGINAAENILSHFLPQLMLVTIQTLLIVYFGFNVFGLTHYGSLWLTGLLMLLAGMCGMFYGAVIAHYCTNERSAYYLTAGTFVCVSISSDVMWTAHGMPPLMKTIFELFPFIHAIDAMRSLMYKEADLTRPEVSLGFMQLGVWIGIFLIMLLIHIRAQHK